MKKPIGAVLALVFTFFAGSAAASPTTYEMVVDSCRAGSSGTGPCNVETIDAIEATELVMSAGSGSYEYKQTDSTISLTDSGLDDIFIALAGLQGSIYPVAPGRLLCVENCDLKVSASVGAGSLGATFSVNTGPDELHYSGDQGYISSDFLPVSGTFTGHFVEENAVPEPATLGLASLACLAVLRTRKQVRRGGASV